MTFSIVARVVDPGTGEPNWGVAVASKFLAVGSAVPAAVAGVGAIATQAEANVAYKGHALAHLDEGATAAVALERLLEEDERRDYRQRALDHGAGAPPAALGAAARCRYRQHPQQRLLALRSRARRCDHDRRDPGSLPRDRGRRSDDVFRDGAWRAAEQDRLAERTVDRHGEARNLVTSGHHQTSAPPPNEKKDRKKLDAAKAIDRPNTI